MDRFFRFERDELGDIRVFADAPGERAVSAPIPDPLQAIRDLAFVADLEVDDSDESRLVISIPPGA